jgi:ABC-type transport system substrate-binding protein
MKISKIAKILILLTLLTIPTITVSAQTVEKSGPYADELFFKIYLNQEAEYLALKTGEVNIMDWELPAEKVPDAMADPNINTVPIENLGYYLIDLNCQRWPTSNVHFRRALAHLVDKPRIETDVLQGFGYSLDSPVPVVLGGWANPDIRTYEYSQEKAAMELELGGFIDTDGDGIRNDPQTGANMAEVIFYIRIDDAARKQAGEWLAQELKDLGVPVTGENAVERAVCSQAVMLDSAGEWNVYTGGWGLTRDPDHLTDFYHSKEFDPETIGGWRGYNYPGFVNSTYDEWGDILKSASTFEEVKEAAFVCQEILAEQVPGIPMYGVIGVKAYSSEWTGVVNEVGEGINSWWSVLNMHPANVASGGRIEYAVKSDIETLNPLTASWTYTWEVLDKVFEPVYTWNPYDLSEDWPWLAESWEIEEWTSPTGPGTKITFHFLDYAKWHDGTPFTAEDLKFTYEFIQEYKVPRYLPSVQYIQKMELVDDYTLEVYQNTTSYFAFHYLNIDCLLPKHIWEDVGAGWQDYDPAAEGTLIGLGPWKFVEYVPGEYVHFVANRDYFMHPTVLLEQEVSSLEKQLDEAAKAGEEAAKDIAGLSSQISQLQESTLSALTESADEIKSLESQISTLENEITSLETEVSTLQGGLTSASNIGYASIVIAIVVGAIAVFMARREA